MFSVGTVAWMLWGLLLPKPPATARDPAGIQGGFLPHLLRGPEGQRVLGIDPAAPEHEPVPLSFLRNFGAIPEAETWDGVEDVDARFGEIVEVRDDQPHVW